MTADLTMATASKGVDGPRVEQAVREYLLAIGEDPDGPGLMDTPARVARAAAEIFGGLHEDPWSIWSYTAAHDTWSVAISNRRIRRRPPAHGYL